MFTYIWLIQWLPPEDNLIRKQPDLERAQCVISSQPGIICQGICLTGHTFSATQEGWISFLRNCRDKQETFVCEQKGMSRLPCKLEHSLKACTLTWSWTFESSPLETGFTSLQSIYLAHPAAIRWHFMK